MISREVEYSKSSLIFISRFLQLEAKPTGQTTFTPRLMDRNESYVSMASHQCCKEMILNQKNITWPAVHMFKQRVPERRQNHKTISSDVLNCPCVLNTFIIFLKPGHFSFLVARESLVRILRKCDFYFCIEVGRVLATHHIPIWP